MTHQENITTDRKRFPDVAPLRRSFALGYAALLLSLSAGAQVIGWNHPASPPPYGVFSIGTSVAGVETGRSITLDAAGNVYVYGTFAGTADFDPGIGTNTATANGTSSDLFIAKYNPSGAFQWVARGGVANSGDNGSGNIGAIRTDGTNVYVVGSLAVSGASATFSPAAGGCTCAEPMSATTTRGFVGKLDSATGTWQWMNSFGGIGLTQNGGHGVALDPTGNVYVVGQVNGNFTLGALPPISTTDAQLFFAKLNSSGVWQWAKTAGGTGADGAGQSGGGITYNANLNRVTATGSYNSTGATFGAIGIPNSATNDIFLTELDSSTGNFLSAFGLGGAGASDECGGVVYDPLTHDIFLGGQMSGSLSLPGLGTLLQASAGNDIFVGRFVPNATPLNGVFSWGKSFGLAGSDRAYDIATNANGRVYITGWFTGPGTVNFGTGAATQVTSTGTGNDIYVASLSVSGIGAWAVQGVEPGANLDQGRGVGAAQDNSGTVWATGQFNVGAVSWTPSSLGNTITLTSAGTSDVWVGRIYGGLPLSATESHTNPACNGTCTGSATVVASGGVPPYTYSWSPSGGSGATASNMCALIYTCTISDAAGSSIPKSVTITQPPFLSVAAASQTNVNCASSTSGAASVNATGGTGTLTYNWTPGNPTGDGTASVTGLTVGSWTCTVTDANSCATPRVFSITQLPATLTASAGAGGTIAPTGTVNVLCGGSQSFVIAPATGDVINDVLVDAVSVGAVPNYSFTNLLANHTIAASFRAIPGEVPDRLSLGTPLRIAKNAITPANLDLSWGDGCGAAQTDFAVYEGTIGTWYSHASRLCTTGGGFTANNFVPAVASRYYLVVPVSATKEGSYGTRSTGAQIPPGTGACFPTQDTATCP